MAEDIPGRAVRLSVWQKGVATVGLLVVLWVAVSMYQVLAFDGRIPDHGGPGGPGSGEGPNPTGEAPGPHDPSRFNH